MESEGTGNSPQATQAVKDEAINQAQELKSATVEHAGAVTQEARGKAVDVMHDVRREVETQGDAQARRLATVLDDAGRQLQGMAEGGEPGPVTDVTRQIGGGAQRLAGRLEDGGISGVGDDLRGFAQRQPGLFLAAAGLAGFLLTRALRNTPSASSVGASTSPQPGRPPMSNGFAGEPVLATGVER
jgi:hypothetical protein